MAFSHFGTGQRSLETDDQMSYFRPVSPSVTIYSNRPARTVGQDTSFARTMLRKNPNRRAVFDPMHTQAQKRS